MDCMILYTALATYNVSNNLLAHSAIVSQGLPTKRAKFSHCFQDHPCSHLTGNCTHGHILDVQYGGVSQCYNCAPQDPDQQITHTLWQTDCFARDLRLHVDVIPSSAPCGFDFVYTCAAAAILTRSSVFVLLFSVITAICAQQFSAPAGYIWPLQASGLVPAHTKDTGIAFPYVSLRHECAYILTTNTIWPAQCNLPDACGAMLTKQALPGKGFFGEKDICFRTPHVSRYFSIFQWSGGLPGVVLIPPYGSFAPDVTTMPLLAVDAPDNICGIYRSSTARHALHVRITDGEAQVYFHNSIFDVQRECHWVNTTPAFDYVDCEGLWDYLPSGTVVANYHARDLFLSRVNITYSLIDQPVTTHGELRHYTHLLDYIAAGDLYVSIEGRVGNYSSLHYVSTHLTHSVCTNYAVANHGDIINGSVVRLLVAADKEVRIKFKTSDPNCELWIRLGVDNLYSNIQQCATVLATSPLILFPHKFTAIVIEFVLGDVLVSHEGILLMAARVPDLRPSGPELSAVGVATWHICEQLFVGRGEFVLSSPSFVLRWYIFDPSAFGFVAPVETTEKCVRNLRSLSDFNWIEGFGLKILSELERLLARVFTEVLSFILTSVYESLLAFSSFIVKFHIIEAAFLALLAQLQWHDVYLTSFIMGLMIVVFN